MHGAKRSFVPAGGVGYYDTNVSICTWYCTSCIIHWNCSKYFVACCQIQSDGDSECTPQYTSKYILKHTSSNALKEASNCTQWHTPSLLDSLLPSKLPWHTYPHSGVHSQLHTQLCLMTHFEPAWLDTFMCALMTLPSVLQLCFQVHSWAFSSVHSKLHSMVYF